MKKHILFPAIPVVLFCLGFGSNAQTVSTFVTESGLFGPDGFALDSAQNLYVANYFAGSGKTVLKINPSAQVSVIDSTSQGPDGLVIDQWQNLYISNFNNGYITKTDVSGNKATYANGFTNPSAMVFDPEGNLYVSDFGAGMIRKITPDITVTDYAIGLHGPIGLVFDPIGNLFVSNYLTGEINKIAPDGTMTVFATVPDPVNSRIQYLARGTSGNLYLPAYNHNKIYRITPDGTVSVLAGTGAAGGNDGPAATATFDGPNSIVLTPEGDLFVSEYNANRIRKIEGVETMNGDKLLNKNSLINLSIQSADPVQLITSNAIPGNQLLKVYNLAGLEVLTVVSAQTDAGRHIYPLNKNCLSAGIYVAVLWFNNSLAATQKFMVN